MASPQPKPNLSTTVPVLAEEPNRMPQTLHGAAEQGDEAEILPKSTKLNNNQTDSSSAARNQNDIDSPIPAQGSSKCETNVAISVPTSTTTTTGLVELQDARPKLDKRQTLAQIRALGIRAAALERDTTSRLKFRGTGETRAEHEALEAHREKLARNRDNDAASLTSALEKTRGEVKQFRDMLQNISSAPSFVARVQRLMSQIEGDVLALKDAQRQAYEDLLAREKLLTRDLAAFEERLQQWDRPGAMQPVPAGTGRDGGTCQAVPAVAGGTEGMPPPPEVAALDDFLKTSRGPTGGWTEYDHGVFLRERQRHRSESAVVAAVTTKLVGRTEEAVAEHAAWYATYLDLVERKKAAIKRWRQQRRQEHQQSLVAASEANGQKSAQASRAERRRAAAREQERREKSAQVAAWREEQRAQARRADEEQRAAERRARRAARDKERAHRAEQKALVAEYLAQKHEHEAARAKAVAEEQATDGGDGASQAEMLAYFQQRDQKVFEQQVARREQAEREKEEQVRRMARLKQHVRVSGTRDPSRLLQPTAATLARTHDDTPPAGRVIARAPPRLAVPAWRKGL
eukprot:m.694995 g.694995  ORF g.694995 m.694995 type:complete len:575 (+) comp22886_c0_seq9:132-1856(+)